MGSAEFPWKDFKQMLSGFSSSQLAWACAGPISFECKERVDHAGLVFLSDDTKQGHLAPSMNKNSGCYQPKRPWRRM